jgi:hypothetical protein
VVRDFSNYRRLCCAFRVVEGPLDLVISVRSGRGALIQTHYDVQRPYPAGEHLVRLDLAVIAPKARPRPLDLSDVEAVQFFVCRPDVTRTVYVQRIWLEN